MDNIQTKSIMTFKSGKFVFSSKYAAEKLNVLLWQANLLYETVSDLPILPKYRAKIDKDIIIKSIFSTAAIEGNPLSEQKVGEIIENPAPVKSKEVAEKEISNLESAYKLVDEFAEKDLRVNEEIIRKIHFTLTNGIDHKYNLPGQYRNEKVQVGDDAHGGIYTPPVILDDIVNIMKVFVEWIESPEITALGPITKAALAHYHLGLIHPFSDGNGRTARLLEAMILKSARIKYIPRMLSNYYYQNINDYYKVFRDAAKSAEYDITPFVEFVCKGHIACASELKTTIIYFIRRLSLADYFKYCRKRKAISDRQYRFLELLLDHQKEFTLSDLFNMSPFSLLYRDCSERTARRDLKKLADARLLLTTEGGKYILNIKALD